MKVQEMEILSGSGRKADPFGVLVLCMHKRIVTAMNIWIPVYFWMRWGVNVRNGRSSMYRQRVIWNTAAGVYESWYVWVLRCTNS